MKPPEAHQSDRQDVDGRPTTDNCHLVSAAGRPLTAARRLSPATAGGRRQPGDGRGASWASATTGRMDNGTDNAANGDIGGQRHNNTDENGGGLQYRERHTSSHVMTTDAARETSLRNERASGYVPNSTTPTGPDQTKSADLSETRVAVVG